VRDLDDERFETYLKQFRPLVPDNPPTAIRPAPRRHLATAIWVIGAVAMVILGVTSLRMLNHRIPDQANHPVVVKLPTATPSLTMRYANNLLATAPSYKAVMNDLAFSSKSSSISNDKQSALLVLGKEKIKL
jgi:hypothetical protein